MFQRKADGIAINGLGALDGGHEAARAGFVLGIQDPVEMGRDVGGFEIAAVMILHAGAQFQGPGDAVIAVGP